MDSSRVLYTCEGSPYCFRTLLALEEKELTYENRILDITKQEQKSPEVLALNPRGQVPTFRDGDAIVNESDAILLYLENQYRDKPLLPEDPVTKALVLQRFVETNVLLNKLRPFARSKMSEVEDPQEEQYIAIIKDELMLWEGYVTKHKYLAADTLTLADLSFASIVLALERYGLTFMNHPNLKKYCELVKNHPLAVKIWSASGMGSPAPHDFMKVF